MSGAPEKKQERAISQKTTQDKVVSGLVARMIELEERVQTLERTNLALQARLSEVERGRSSSDLSEVGAELARFDCELEFNRAHALALAQRTPGYTMEGAAALNCKQRLARVTEKAVRSLQNH